MNAIILDTNIIIRYPKILSIKIDNTDIFTTPDILSEVGNRAEDSKNGSFTFTALLDLIQNAIVEGTLIRHQVSSERVNNESDLFFESYRLSYGDRSLIILAREIAHAYEKVYIATQDDDLKKNALKLGLNVLNPQNIQEYLNQNQPKNTSLATKLTLYERSASSKFFQGIIFGILVTILIFTLYFNFKSLIQSINIWGTISLSIILGIALFIFREKRRLSYGIFEFLSGVGVIILIFYPSFDYSIIRYSFDFYAKLLGGLYVMVRGQDNIIRSLQGKKWGLWIKDKTGIG